MLNALHSAATGMESQQSRIDSIANDLANINTVGYKKSRPEFEDLYYDQIKTPGALNAQSIESPNGIQIGHGTRMTSLSKVFTAGDLQQTGGSLDVAIEGAGFLQLTDDTGATVYSRNGVMQVDKDGNLVNAAGMKVTPNMTVPATATSITIGKDGTISAKTPDSSEPTVLGQLQLAMFANPAGLEYAGGNILKETSASGSATLVTPGADGSGTLAQGFVESSNVNVAESLINMVVAQRSYESNSKVIETADRMMQAVNNVL